MSRTTREMIWEWLKRGCDTKRNFMLVMTDKFDYEDYPVYCDTLDEVRAEIASCSFQNMKGYMESYDLNGNLAKQVANPLNRVI